MPKSESAALIAQSGAFRFPYLYRSTFKEPLLILNGVFQFRVTRAEALSHFLYSSPDFQGTLTHPCGVFQIRFTRVETFSCFIYSAPSFQGLRSEHVHASDRAFLFRQHPCGKLSPANSRKAFTLHRAFQHSPLGSLLWWLFLHRRLRSPATRLKLAPERLGTL